VNTPYPCAFSLNEAALYDDDERRAPNCGEVEALVKRACRSRTVTNVGERNARLVAKLKGKRYAGHHFDHYPEVRD
jgi:hypothetical protein